MLKTQINKQLNNQSSRSRLSSGFSLVEVLLVMMVVIFIALLIANLPPTIRLSGNSAHESLAKEIASQQIEILRGKTYGNLSGNGTTAISDTRVSQLPGGAGTVTIADCPAAICTNDEPLKQITVTVSWLETKNTTSIKLDTLIGQGGIK